MNNNNKTNFIFIYSENCKYSKLIMSDWQKFKLYITNNKINVNLFEYKSNELNNLDNIYKSQLVGYPTLFISNNNVISKKFEGYDEILNYLNN